MFKKIIAAAILFLTGLTGAMAQSTIPTLKGNNSWIGTNTYLAGHLILQGGNSCAAQGHAGQVLVGFAQDFTPICMAVSGVSGVASVNSLTGNINITNGGDSNISISLQGQNIQVGCPGCGTGGGGSPGGGQGALQWNNSGAFAGTVVTGIVKSSAAGPVAAIPDTDFALPFTLTCSNGISCPKVGENYSFTATGSAGTGDVANGNFGQVGGYAAAGTTISGQPNIYSINPAWSQNQVQALFARFNGANVTGYSITSNVITFNAANSFNAGDVVDTFGFPATSSFLNNAYFTVLSTGLSSTQFEAAITQANTTSTDTGTASYNTPFQQYSYGLVVIPPGYQDEPTTSYTNTLAQTLDWRKGYAWQQMSQYSVKCDAKFLNVTLTAGSNTVNVGSSFGSVNPMGMTMVVGAQQGFGQNGVQWDWEPTVTGFSYPNITLSSRAPVNFNGVVIFGTNNQAALTTAFNDATGVFPLNIPTGCLALTDTVRWNGDNVIGQQMGNSGFIGFPGHDILQQQDGIPVTSWAINATLGITTFTFPVYASHNVLVNDVVNFQNFTSSTFFNNQTATIISQPSPTTFVVNSIFGQTTRSGTENGLAAPTSGANTNGLRVENLTFFVNNSIDPSFQWNHYDGQTGNVTVQPPYYRPIQEFGQPMNNPFGSGWGTDQINGIATIAQNSAVICSPNTGRIPVVGTTIIFPYQGAGLYSGTVSSTAGSCASGFTARTLSAALPNVTAFTSSSAEWFTYLTPQTLSASIPSTISYPYTITLNLPVAPVPGYISNVSSHGRIIINNDEFDYMGITYGTTNGTSQLVLRDGPTSINNGSGDSSGSVVFPLNPCQAMYNNPWPVVPTLTTGMATPAYATYYAGNCGGNAAMALPSADADAWTSVSSGLSVAFLKNLAGSNVTANSLGNTNNNGSMFLYEQGVNTGYGNTFEDIRVNGLWGGIIQGPSSVNQNGVRVDGPTSTGQNIRDCTFRTGYAMAFDSIQQSSIDRCDTYSTETSPYDGTTVGASTGLYLNYSLSEQDGSIVTSTDQITVKDYSNEPENGNHFEVPVSLESDCNNCNFIQTIFEGGFNIFGGTFQILHGTFMGNPTFNYGSNNYFEHLYGLTTGYNSPNLYDSAHNQFYNWGTNSTCQSASGGYGPQTNCTPGLVQSYDGHDLFAAMSGSLTHPAENVLGGMIVPGEWSNQGNIGNSMTTPLVFDNTEPWWGSHAECLLGTSGQSCTVGEFDGFNGFIYIGPHERIANAPYILKAEFKSSSSLQFTLLVQAVDSGTGQCTTPGTSLINSTITATTSWTPTLLPIDFSNNAGCALKVTFENATSNGTLQVGYFNFIPFPGSGSLFMPLGTHTAGDACPLAGQFETDSTNFWICKPTSGIAFGPGTWQNTTGGGSGSAITGLNGDVTATGPGSVTGTVTGINGVNLASLSNGLYTFASGVPSAAVNIQVPGTISAGTTLYNGVNRIATCSGTVIFDASFGNDQYCVLTGNVTSSTLINLPTTISLFGQAINFTICQDTTGGRTFVPPTNLNGWAPVTTVASTTTSPYNSCTTETFHNTAGVLQSDQFNSANCISSASPAVCGQAIQGEIAVPAGTNPTLVIDTTGYSSTHSQLVFSPDATIGTDLSVTCNTGTVSGWQVSAATSGTSVTLQVNGTFTTNPVCGKFYVRNP